MKWLKIAAVIVGLLIAFVLIGDIVGFIMHLVGYVLLAALVAGGGYVAYKVLSARGGDREVRDRDRDRGRQVRAETSRADDLRQQQAITPPPARPNVEDELSRLKREMGS